MYNPSYLWRLPSNGATALLKDLLRTPSQGSYGSSQSKRAKTEKAMLIVNARRYVEVLARVDIAATVGDLVTHLAEVEVCHASCVTVICGGVVLNDASMELRSIELHVAVATGVVDASVAVVYLPAKVAVWYMVRKTAARPYMPTVHNKAAPDASPGTASCNRSMLAVKATKIFNVDVQVDIAATVGDLPIMHHLPDRAVMCALL